MSDNLKYKGLEVHNPPSPKTESPVDISSRIKHRVVKGYAPTKHGNAFIIDNNSFIISKDPVPKDLLNNVIKTRVFEYYVEDDKLDNKSEDVNILVEKCFEKYCIVNNIKYKSKNFYKEQHTYFNAALAILGFNYTKWVICLISGREIVKDYTNTNIYNNKPNIT